MRKLSLIGGKNKRRTDKVYDEEGVMRQGKEAVEEWGRYFERVLNEEVQKCKVEERWR